MEETYRFVQEFKPELFDAKLKEATAERNKAKKEAAYKIVLPSQTEEARNQRLAEQSRAAGKAGGRGRITDSQGVVNTQANGHGSTNIPYPVRRLKRDAPAVAAEFAAGKYPPAPPASRPTSSKYPPPLDLLRRAQPRTRRLGCGKTFGNVSGPRRERAGSVSDG